MTSSTSFQNWNDGSNAFTFSQFQALFTLFPKLFSPFPHGTCSLSVTYIIFILGRILSPMFTLQYQTMLLVPLLHYHLSSSTGLSPSLVLQIKCSNSPRLESAQEARPTLRFAALQDGMVSFHSQLLRKSHLVYIPPLNNMLKSSG